MSYSSRIICIGILLCSAIVPACSDHKSPISPRKITFRSFFVRPDGLGDYPTIQAAIDAASKGDTIQLANGRYMGDGNRDLDFRGLGIVLRSQFGDPVYCVIDCDGTPQEPHRGVWFHSQETAATVIENLTIEHGYESRGGTAILCENASSPTIRNLVISSNENRAVLVSSSLVTMENCVFESNQGGTLLVRDSSSVVLKNCIFRYNLTTAGSGGAIVNLSSSLELSECLFRSNAAALTGGAIVSAAESGHDRSTMIVVSCVFSDNTAGYHGGALHFDQTDFSIQGCIFLDNTAGINGGAFWCHFESEGNIGNTLFYGNRGESGGAINCGIVNSLNIDDTIIAFNTGNEGLYCDTLYPTSLPQLRCSDIYGNEGGDWTGVLAGQLGENGNIAEDPLFCNQFDGDFRLQSTSPCKPANGCGLIGPLDIGCDSTLFVR
jgi:predicted outer membrane repeat protein